MTSVTHVALGGGRDGHQLTIWCVLLLVAVVAKRGFDQPEGVSVMGPIHGMLFLAYIGLVLLARDELRWGARQTIVTILASAVPFGSLAVERRPIPPSGNA